MAGKPLFLIGCGSDDHKIIKSHNNASDKPKPLVLAGNVISEEHSPVAHSDGDAVYNAIINALLLAIGERDIGHYFPDTDPKYAGISRYVKELNDARKAYEKAIDELSRKAGERLYCRISVPKTIPVAAGLGGGSADAAAVLRIANIAFGLHLDTEELEEIARKIGNDVSFLLYGGRALVEGGKKHNMKEMDTPKLYYVIARPKMKLSTKEMYALHDKTGKDFTELASELCPDTKKIRSIVKESDPVESGVTGKGPTVFGAYKKYKECESVADRLSWLDGDVFIERSVDKFV